MGRGGRRDPVPCVDGDRSRLPLWNPPGVISRWFLCSSEKPPVKDRPHAKNRRTGATSIFLRIRKNPCCLEVRYTCTGNCISSEVCAQCILNSRGICMPARPYHGGNIFGTTES